MRKSALCFAVSLIVCLYGSRGARGDLVSRWTFDGDIVDSGPAGNDGVFQGAPDPTFVEGQDGAPVGAILFDGLDDLIELAPLNGLPIYSNEAYSVTLWVNGGPQADRRVFSESNTTTRNPLFNIGTQNGGVTGQVDIYIRDVNNTVVVNHRLSSGIAFDNAWHHIAWVDDNGAAVLYIDGIRDATDFTYTKVAMPFTVTTIGGILRNTPSHWFSGMIDDVQVFDHALSEYELLCMLPQGCPPCPPTGDTHCGSISVTGPGGDLTGPYTVIAQGATDDSGDAVQYRFEARSAAGTVLTAGPQPEDSTVFQLGSGTWTISATVDDDSTCADVAPDATCTAPPQVVNCPPVGDTHCTGIGISLAPADGSPGTYSLIALGVSDDSGDPVSFTFRAQSNTGIVLVAGPQAADTANLFLNTGTWAVSVTVDDDLTCPDAAGDSTCSTQVEVICPDLPDTHCGGLTVVGPPEATPGTYTATVDAATDESGDPILYTFRAESKDGRTVQAGPGANNSAPLMLGPGEWTIRATVDDNLACFDAAADASCEMLVDVLDSPNGLIGHWTFDGDTVDHTGNGNDGLFQGGAEIDPVYVEGFDGTIAGAIQFDGIDDHVAVTQNKDLPLYAQDAFTIAMWVRGGIQPDFRVWSEGWSLANAPLFTMGTESTGVTGQADIFLRNTANQVFLGHLRSQRNAFDDAWHHLAYVDDGGNAAIYIDAVREQTVLVHAKPQLALDRSSIGCVLRAAASHFFRGTIDDVRAYNYALTDSEIAALVPQPAECPVEGDSYCGTLDVAGPRGSAPGIYTATLTGASDGAGDPLVYTFTARHADGPYLQVGPQAQNTAQFNLFAGEWTISATADDDLLCRDQAASGTCQAAVSVTGPPEELLSHWKLDGDLIDAQPALNHGTFYGGDAPAFVEDRNAAASKALLLDGIDDHVVISRQKGLPLYGNRGFSIAMWVKGLPQPDRRVWSESAAANNNPLFTIGTHNGGASGQVDLYVRDAVGTVIVPHALSAGIAFDGTWHHIAYVDTAGNGALYIDGLRDPAAFNYVKPALPLDVATIGGIVRAGPCCFFNGSIDDVRAYTFALSASEVREVVEDKQAPEFRRGDPDGSGSLDLTDAVFILNYLFLAGTRPSCIDAADTDDSGSLDLTDAVYSLNFQFLAGPPFPFPGPIDCGADGSPDENGGDLGCDSYGDC